MEHQERKIVFHGDKRRHSNSYKRGHFKARSNRRPRSRNRLWAGSDMTRSMLHLAFTWVGLLDRRAKL